MREQVTSFPALPRPPTNAELRLREDQQRGPEPQRERIEDDAERTVVSPNAPPAVADSEDLTAGCNLVVMREVSADRVPRLAEERFVIREKLSSERNIAGDVFRATRYWDGQLYGDVVLKKPKSSLRGSPEDYERACRDLEREERSLFRFARHPSLLSATGPPFVWDGEMVLQSRYLPWSITEYLTYFSEEGPLTAGLAGVACQCLSAIEHMSISRDGESPLGYAHVDFKVTHLRMDYRERGRADWVVVIIDLDSVWPVGPVSLKEAKFNRACVDPEKFMALHDPTLLVTVDPTETVYALGVSLLRVLADGLGVLLERRRVQPVGLASGPDGTIAADPEGLRSEIERTRQVDWRNLAAVFQANEGRRREAALPDCTLAELEPLWDEDRSGQPQLTTGSPPGWTVRPDFFLGLLECLRPRAERLDPRRLRALFGHLLQR